jgi:SAM-dependent methyltransferase
MPASGNLPSAPAAARNYEPILGVLLGEFGGCTRVLEIGSGTGQHAAGFAAAMPWLSWQPSDLEQQVPDIRRWVEAAALDNLAEPVVLDAGSAAPTGAKYDGAFSANTAHIMSEPDVERMFALVGHSLAEGGRFCLYGPFREDGRFSTESNERFDAALRAGDPAKGVRDLERLDDFATRVGMHRQRRYAMPGNNLLLVYERLPGRPGAEGTIS